MAEESKKLPEIKLLQTKILKRYLSEEELEKFMKEYTAHKKVASGRFSGLSKPLTKKQRKNLLVYCFGGGESVRELSEEMGQTAGALVGSAHRAAMKILYQTKTNLN